jgi:tripartite-type tricarboxylate transporter receptor subunit TctC
VAQWRGGKLRPLCVFDSKRLPYKDKIADQAWGDIPTCKESGLDVEYLMLRGIFMPPEVKPEQVAFYVDLMQKVRATPEWKKFMDEGAFNQTVLTGAEYARWVASEEIRHRLLMQEAGFVAK